MEWEPIYTYTYARVQNEIYFISFRFTGDYFSLPGIFPGEPGVRS